MSWRAIHGPSPMLHYRESTRFLHIRLSSNTSSKLSSGISLLQFCPMKGCVLGKDYTICLGSRYNHFSCCTISVVPHVYTMHNALRLSLVVGCQGTFTPDQHRVSQYNSVFMRNWVDPMVRFPAWKISFVLTCFWCILMVHVSTAVLTALLKLQGLYPSFEWVLILFSPSRVYSAADTGWV